MPIYEYKCGKCGRVFEHFVFTETVEESRTCPLCHAAGAEKIISSFSSLFCSGNDGCGPINKKGFS